MIEKPEPTDEIKRKHVKEALDILGFVENMDFYVKPHKGTIKIIVDFTDDKRSVYFRDGTTVIRQDDEEGALAKVGKVIIDAELGIMPSRPGKDGGQEPPPPVPQHTKKSEKKVPDQKELSQPEEPDGFTPAELVHNPAAPVQEFQPQGRMILTLQPGLAQKGRIKIGGLGEKRKSQKTGNDYRPPVKLNHFVIATNHKDDNGNYIIDHIMKTWGFSGTMEDGPIELDVYLLYNDPIANFTTSFAQYKGGKCMCRGDGINAVQADGTKIDCNTETCPIFKSKQCKPNGILSVILKDAPTLGGVYNFRTTSMNSIRQIYSSMFFIKSASGGTLANLPLKMTLSPKTVNPIDSPTAQTVYIVNLEFPGNAEELREKTIELVQERASMRQEILKIEEQARLAICAPESEEDMREIEEEYYPED